MGFSKFQIQNKAGARVALFGEGVGDDAIDSGPKRSITNLLNLFHNNLVQGGENARIDNVYINGLFFNFFKWLFFKGKLVIAPRGMASPKALEIKGLKKRGYLYLFKIFRFHKRVRFHATSIKEEKEIQQLFVGAEIIRIPNVPYLNFQMKKKHKGKGELKMISVAQVSPLKNYHKIIGGLKQVQSSIYWEIIGGALYPNYYQEIMEAIKTLPDNIKVTYRGELSFGEVEKRWGDNHIQVLPSESENFGHAHFEGLANSLPLITSFEVPWAELHQHKAGLNIPISEDEIAKSIEFFARMNEGEFHQYQFGAITYAQSRVDETELKTAYTNMFFNEIYRP